MKPKLLAAIGLTLLTAGAFGQMQQMVDRAEVTPSGEAAQKQINFTRDVLSKMGVEQRLGKFVPGDVPFQDEQGRTIKIGDLFGTRPIVIMPMFFECKGVCGVETDSLIRSAIQIEDLSVGVDYDVIMLSINPKENAELTLPRWKSTVKLYGRKDADRGFHFLTGSLDNIRKVTDSLGFKWVYDAKENTINHPAGLMVLTPKG